LAGKIYKHSTIDAVRPSRAHPTKMLSSPDQQKMENKISFGTKTPDNNKVTDANLGSPGRAGRQRRLDDRRNLNFGALGVECPDPSLGVGSPDRGDENDDV